MKSPRSTRCLLIRAHRRRATSLYLLKVISARLSGRLRNRPQTGPSRYGRHGAVRPRWYNLGVANLAVRRRRFRFGTLALALVCLVARAVRLGRRAARRSGARRGRRRVRGGRRRPPRARPRGVRRRPRAARHAAADRRSASARWRCSTAPRAATTRPSGSTAQSLTDRLTRPAHVRVLHRRAASARSAACAATAAAARWWCSTSTTSRTSTTATATRPATRCLAKVGAAIRHEQRESDISARFGGEELVVLVRAPPGRRWRWRSASGRRSRCCW